MKVAVERGCDLTLEGALIFFTLTKFKEKVVIIFFKTTPIHLTGFLLWLFSSSTFTNTPRRAPRLTEAVRLVTKLTESIVTAVLV